MTESAEIDWSLGGRRKAEQDYLTQTLGAVHAQCLLNEGTYLLKPIEAPDTRIYAAAAYERLSPPLDAVTRRAIQSITADALEQLQRQCRIYSGDMHGQRTMFRSTIDLLYFNDAMQLARRQAAEGHNPVLWGTDRACLDLLPELIEDLSYADWHTLRSPRVEWLDYRQKLRRLHDYYDQDEKPGAKADKVSQITVKLSSLERRQRQRLKGFKPTRPGTTVVHADFRNKTVQPVFD